MQDKKKMEIRITLPLETPLMSQHEKSSQPNSVEVINTHAGITLKIFCDKKNNVIFILFIYIFYIFIVFHGQEVFYFIF